MPNLLQSVSKLVSLFISKVSIPFSASVKTILGLFSNNVCKYFVDKLDGDKNPPNPDGRTPLHDAAANGHNEIVKYIMDFIEDKNLKDEEGYTPMYLAIKNGHFEVFEFIIDLGGNPNAARKNDRTILHDAAANGNIIIVNYLMDFIANKSLKDKQGLTPMHLAVLNGNYKVPIQKKNTANKEKVSCYAEKCSRKLCMSRIVRKIMCYCNNSPKYRVFPNIDNTYYNFFSIKVNNK